MIKLKIKITSDYWSSNNSFLRELQNGPQIILQKAKRQENNLLGFHVLTQIQ